MERGTRFTECQQCKGWATSIVDQYPCVCDKCGVLFDVITNSPEFFYVEGEFGNWQSNALEKRKGEKGNGS